MPRSIPTTSGRQKPAAAGIPELADLTNARIHARGHRIKVPRASATRPPASASRQCAKREEADQARRFRDVLMPERFSAATASRVARTVCSWADKQPRCGPAPFPRRRPWASSCGSITSSTVFDFRMCALPPVEHRARGPLCRAAVSHADMRSSRIAANASAASAATSSPWSSRGTIRRLSISPARRRATREAAKPAREPVFAHREHV